MARHSFRTPDVDEDRSLLEALVASADPAEDIDRAFADMLARLRESGRPMTDRQHAFAEAVATERGLSWARNNAHVPTGRAVEMAPVLQNRPLRPPGRR